MLTFMTTEPPMVPYVPRMDTRTALIACVLQLLVMVMAIFIRPEPMLVVYSTYATPYQAEEGAHASGNHSFDEWDDYDGGNNRAAIAEGYHINLAWDQYGASPLFLISSLLISLFAGVTQQLEEQQLLDNALQYSEELMAQTGMWDLMLWIMFLSTHTATLTCLLSPVSASFLLLILLVFVLCMAGLCYPGPKPHATILILVFVFGVMAAFHRMPVQHGLRMAAFAFLLLNDLLLLLGHIYDQCPNTRTLANCRLCHAFLSSMVLLTAYGVAI